MKKTMSKHWVQGVGLALSEAYAHGAEPDVIVRTSSEIGLTRDDYRDAGLERFDLDRLRNAGVPTRKQEEKVQASVRASMRRAERTGR